MVDEAELPSPICSTFEVLVAQCAVRCCCGQNWVLSIDKCQLRVLQFSVHFINLLSILLRCNGFTGIQKVVVDQTGSRPPAVTMTFFFGGGVQVWLWEVLWSFFSVQPLS